MSVVEYLERLNPQFAVTEGFPDALGLAKAIKRKAWEERHRKAAEYREQKFYIPGWLYDTAVRDGLDKKLSYWHLIHKYAGTVNPKEELLMRVNNTIRGQKNQDPVNWPGRRGFLTQRTF